MEKRRKFSVFISSTYEDLKQERQALIGVALENSCIPVGMEQFHAAPKSQWEVITKMIDECDFYLLIIGGRYGSIDEETGISYTEKEYNYAKSKKMPVLVLIKNPSVIIEREKDTGDDKYIKMQKLDDFRKKVRKDKNTVDDFDDLGTLKYVAAQALKNAIGYIDENAGWVRYCDIVDLINEEVKGRNKINTDNTVHQQKMIDNMTQMLSQFKNKLEEINSQVARQEFPVVTTEDINNLFLPGNKLQNAEPDQIRSAIEVGKEDIQTIPIESALLLVYAADGDGQIIKIRTISEPTQISTSGKHFLADNSQRESVRWVEALDRLIEWECVKPIGYKGEIFELTGTGYKTADWLKKNLEIDTLKDPIDELKRFE